MFNLRSLYLSAFLLVFQASVCLSQVQDNLKENGKEFQGAHNKSTIIRNTSNDDPNPPPSKVGQGSPRKGARYRLIFLKSAINSYKKRVAAGNENPDLSSIQSDLRLVQEEAKWVDDQRDPNVRKEIQAAVIEAEAILKRHAAPQH